MVEYNTKIKSQKCRVEMLYLINNWYVVQTNKKSTDRVKIKKINNH